MTILEDSSVNYIDYSLFCNEIAQHAYHCHFQSLKQFWKWKHMSLILYQSSNSAICIMSTGSCFIAKSPFGNAFFSLWVCENPLFHSIYHCYFLHSDLFNWENITCQWGLYDHKCSVGIFYIKVHQRNANCSNPNGRCRNFKFFPDMNG